MKKLGTDSLIYTGGIFLNSILGLIFFILLARSLGPALFGIVSVVIAISVVASDVFDFGLSASILKFLSATPDEKKKELAEDFFTYKIISSLLIIIIGFFISPFLATWLFKMPAAWLTVWLGFLAAGFLGIYGYVNANLQARKRFFSSTALNLSSNGFRLILMICFVLLGVIDVTLSLLAYLLPIITVAIIWGLVDSHITFRPRFTKDIFLPVVKFGKWVAGSSALASITSRLDNFLLVNLTSTFQTGIYTSVQRFFLAFNQIPAGVSLVLTPDFSSSDEKKSQQALKFGLLAAILLTLGIIVFIFLAPWLVPFLLGRDFVLSVIPSQFLAIGTIFFVLASPLNSFILYAKEKPHRLFLLALVQFTATVVFNWLLIPQFQSVGAALAYAGVMLLGFLVTLVSFLK